MNLPARNGQPYDRPTLSLPADMLPPHNAECEEWLIGALLKGGPIAEAAAIAKPEYFYRDAHTQIFAAMVELFDSGKPVDLMTVMDLMELRNTLASVGGYEKLIEAAEKSGSPSSVAYYANIVREHWIRRAVAQAGMDSRTEAYAADCTAEELLGKAEERVFAIGNSDASGNTVTASDATQNAIDRLGARAEGYGGLETGFIDLDGLLDGFYPSQLIILAARPSMGKTALITNIADYVATAKNTGVLFVTLEMNALEIGERLLVARAKVDSHKVRAGKLDYHEMGRIDKASKVSGKLWIDDTATRTAQQIAANAIRHRARHDIGLVIVDYIQLVEPDNTKGANRQEQVAKISRRLKIMAKQLNVPVVALSQLNRGVEAREEKRPRMSDLRESGGIEQDADVVMLLHRPEYYDKNDQPGIAEVIVAKNRNGPTATIKLTFLRNYFRFESFDDTPPIQDFGQPADF